VGRPGRRLDRVGHDGLAGQVVGGDVVGVGEAQVVGLTIGSDRRW
jgi:hypothetical protein